MKKLFFAVLLICAFCQPLMADEIGTVNGGQPLVAEDTGDTGSWWSDLMDYFGF